MSVNLSTARVKRFRWMVWTLLMLVMTWRIAPTLGIVPSPSRWVTHILSCLLVCLWILQGVGLWMSGRAEKRKNAVVSV